jgi:tripartite-type tricarboxylate transporter receptor subunit TctC
MKRLVSVMIVLALLLTAPLVFSQGQQAEDAADFPTKDIEFIVMYGAGGSADQFARAMQPGLEEAFGVNVIVRNIAGGGGAVGFTEALAAKPDGYTVTVPNNALFTLQGMGHVGFKYDDFDTVARVIVEDYVLTTGKQSGLETLEEFIEYAKANPGEIQIGHAGVGASTHMAAVALIDFLGLDVQFIPFDGGSASTAAAMGGHVHAVVQHPAEIISGVESGDLIPVASMGDEPPSAFPNIPTMKSRGLDLSISQWRGMGLPKGVSEEVQQKWIEAIKHASSRPEFKKTIENDMLATVSPIYGLEDTMEFVDSVANVFLPIAQEFSK